MVPARHPLRFSWALWLLALSMAVPALAQGDPNECDEPGDVPDVIVGDIHEVMRHGGIDGITAFSIGTTSCNVGTCWLKWFDDTSEHPVIGQNAFRLKDGRFEQIGQSWLKHGFFAVSGSLCFNDCRATNGEHLGVHCSDPYSAFFNGWQIHLGPKSEVNPTTGVFPYPYGGQGQSGDAIFKRLQLHDTDIDPAQNAEARYFVEAQYVTADDAAAGADENNLGHREVDFVGGGAFIDMILHEAWTTVEGPAIVAWAAADPEVALVTVPSPADGRFVAAAKVTDLGDGRFHYEYAIQNVNSARGARAFRVSLPFGATVSETGFHDVDYHSGEVYSGEDWTVVTEAGAGPHAISFATATVDEHPAANALRWGTLYNFRFSVDAPPASGVLSLELFDPGGDSLLFSLPAPAVCDGDGTCEPGEECSGCPADCGDPGEMCCGDGVCAPGEDPCSCGEDCGFPPAEEGVCDDGVDGDCDGLADCEDPDCCSDTACDNGLDTDGDTHTGCDCNDLDPDVWSAPDEARELRLDLADGETLLDWLSPREPGGTSVVYDVIRAPRPGDFMKASVCVAADSAALSAQDSDPAPLPGGVHFYLVRPENACPDGLGSLGKNSADEPRAARTCP